MLIFDLNILKCKVRNIFTRIPSSKCRDQIRPFRFDSQINLSSFFDFGFSFFDSVDVFLIIFNLSIVLPECVRICLNFFQRFLLLQEIDIHGAVVSTIGFTHGYE